MSDEQKRKILDQTLGEVLQNNIQAQQMIMNAMHITPQQFQEMLNSTASNAASAGIMDMKIGDLFKNGVFQQATAMNQGMPMMATGQAFQITKEQYDQLNQSMQNGQPVPLSQLPMQNMPMQQMPNMQNMGQQIPVQQVIVQPMQGQQIPNGQAAGQIPVMIPVNQTNAQPANNQSFFQKLKNIFK